MFRFEIVVLSNKVDCLDTDYAQRVLYSLEPLISTQKSLQKDSDKIHFINSSNVIILYVRPYIFCFTLKIYWDVWNAHNTLL